MRINCGRRPFSLATRLTFFISLSTIIAFVAIAWITLHSVEKHFAEQDVRDIKQVNTALTKILKTPQATAQRKVERLTSVVDSYHNISVLLLDADGKALYRSPDGPDLTAVLTTNTFSQHINSDDIFLWSREISHDGIGADKGMEHATYRVIATSVNASENSSAVRYTLLIALSIDFHLHYIDELRNNLITIASFISIMIILLVLFAVHKGHQPLRIVSMKIKNITSENLDVRLEPGRVPIELEQLVMSFNHMIERIEDVFTRQANFSADIAHEIRTPITNLVTQTEILLTQRRTEKELEEVLYSNLEEYNRMAKMVSDMLFLAQADSNQLIPERLPLDLNAEAMKVFDFFEAWAEERKVGLRLTGGASLIEGDPLMMRRVINNLLSNAIRYTPQGQSVTVHIGERQEWVELTVENPGHPILKEHLSRLFDRFYRIDPSRQRRGEGSGIGLAIVKSIMTAHQGKIRVESDSVSTRFIISLPRL
ncbi:Cu(+)/Ag(+) sensor histidine kinase [Brenneria populi]|uniref:Sensor protein n=1 Tax=Brenneria populi TaxID=1505588 RepID=A0ABU6JQN3_9GAMM|nr:Cu(+)/Ag(+) sensor histidine kinase [Brenneria populi Li et al. 2015]